ncbi:MAG: aminotransferase class V-fold PLP-dependent enzyme [Bacteroidetes bacterium]|nr:aminotransferase class V-fold PLP-dependent enzyme [Bacteroidota bacterium]
MIKKIKELEKISRLLEPTAHERKEARKKVITYSEGFLNDIEKTKAYNVTPDKGIALLESPISEKPINIDKAIKLIQKNVDFPGLNPASGGYLGYIPGGGIYYSALGDYLAAVFNRYAGVFYAGFGAVRMENMLIQWMAEVFGYSSPSSLKRAKVAGNLTSGGSIANLMAVVTARDSKKISSALIPKSVIYFTKQVHHSIEKAIRIAGLKECVIRHVPMDERYKMNAGELEKLIYKDKKDGLNPFLVIASAGTTDTGTIDPLEEIGKIAKKNNLWYHIDAAYGGFFILTDEGKQKLKGIELSDSLTADPHKGLFLPYGMGVILVKDAQKLRESHYYQAQYLQDALFESEEMSPADLSPELTKHFRGLRLWLPLKLMGVKPFRACLEEKLLLAKYFHSEIQKLGFEVSHEPELSVVTYRWIPKKGDANAFNNKLMKEVVADGRIFISSTLLDKKFTLRFACLSFRTHLKQVDLLLKILKEKVKMLSPS